MRWAKRAWKKGSVKSPGTTKKASRTFPARDAFHNSLLHSIGAAHGSSLSAQSSLSWLRIVAFLSARQRYRYLVFQLSEVSYSLYEEADKK